MEFLTLIIVAAFAFWIGWSIRGIVLLARFGTDPEHFIDILKKIKEINDEEARAAQQDKLGTELAIERHGEMLYAFVKETNQFIAQGKDLNVLLDEAKKRFPNRKFFGVIEKDNPAKELA